jgi:hypothetical protein
MSHNKHQWRVLWLWLNKETGKVLNVGVIINLMKSYLPTAAAK